MMESYTFEMSTFLTGIVIFFIGATFGSFMNVCIYRIPASKSIVHPRSSCPVCGTMIKSYDNIPVLSYLWLRGRCRHCQTPISARYPIVEILAGLFAFCLFNAFGPRAESIAYFAFVASLIVIAFIDIDHRIIPNVISLGGIPIGFVASFLVHRGTMAVFPLPGMIAQACAYLGLPLMTGHSFLGIIIGGTSLWLVAHVYRLITKKTGMGMGDVKLLAMIGAFLGWEGVAFTIFMASTVGSVVGIAMAVYQKKNLKLKIPFGPFLTLGAITHVFFGPYLIRLYFNL